jgi:alpha-beta hydrolase superfamily lysophospholipase
MTGISFLDLPDVLPQFVEGNRSRVIAAGLDPHEYRRVTTGLTSLYDWPAAFRAVGERYRRAARGYAAGGYGVSAGEAYRTAAHWFHCATFLPHPDHAATVAAAGEADDAMRYAFAHLDPGAVRIEGDGFVGWLRRPVGVERPAVVVVVPGLNSGKEEFHALDDALLRRGVATVLLDGPGQGALVDSAPSTEYHRVVGRALDALGAHADLDPAAGVGLIGMSLGGYYAALTAAHDSRIRAGALISGPYRLDWDELPPFITEILTVRTKSRSAAREFARRVDLTDVAVRITAALRVVEGGTDVTPGVTNAEAAAREAAEGELVVVPHGDHLLGNATADWLPSTADWFADRLRSRR